MIDLDDTSNCVLAACCETCDQPRALAVHTVSTVVGVFCMTLCAGCAFSGVTPSLSAPDAVRRSLDHCAHLEITADDMADAMHGGDSRLDH